MPTPVPLCLALVEDAELRQLYTAYLNAQPELQCVLVAASAAWPVRQVLRNDGALRRKLWKGIGA